jgi:hypothetical protein
MLCSLAFSLFKMIQSGRLVRCCYNYGELFEFMVCFLKVVCLLEMVCYVI